MVGPNPYLGLTPFRLPSSLVGYFTYIIGGNSTSHLAFVMPGLIRSTTVAPTPVSPFSSVVTCFKLESWHIQSASGSRTLSRFSSWQFLLSFPRRLGELSPPPARDIRVDSVEWILLPGLVFWLIFLILKPPVSALPWL